MAIFFAIVLFVLSLPSVQNKVIHAITEKVERDLDVDISLESFEFKPISKLGFGTLYVSDQVGDTLIYASDFELSLAAFNPFNQQIGIGAIQMNDAQFHIKRNQLGKLNIYPLLDYLLNDEPTRQQKKRVPWDLSLNNIAIKNLKLSYIDSITKDSYRLNSRIIAVDFESISLEENKVIIDHFFADHPEAHLFELKDKPKDTTKVIMAENMVETDEATKPLQLLVNEISLTKGKLYYSNEKAKANNPYLDFNALAFSDIDLTAKQFILDDSITAKVSSLQLQERSGLVVESMQSDLLINKAGMQFTELVMQTENSTINIDLQFGFDKFSAFKNFEEEVRLNATLDHTLISFRDLAYLFKIDERLIENDIKLSGKLKGPIARLKGRNLFLTLGTQTTFNGNFSLIGLPNINETIINLRVNELRTNYGDLNSLVSNLELPENLKNFGTIRFNGNFNGFVNDFVANGTFNTDIGNMQSDINLKFGQDRKPYYSGELELNQFDLGKWFEQEKLVGQVNLNATLKGMGFKLNDLNATIAGNIQSIEVYNYQYADIEINGLVKDRFFEGKLDVHDENIDFDFNGLADLSKEEPIFKFNANLDHFKLKALNLSKHNYDVSAKLDADFTGKDINQINGKIGLENFQLTDKNLELYTFDSLQLISKASKTENDLSIKSDLLEAKLVGQFQLRNLFNSVSNTLNRHFQFTKHHDIPLTQEVDFELLVYQVKNWPNLLGLDIDQLQNLKGNGSFDSSKERLQLTLDLDYIRVNQFTLKELNAVVETREHYVNTKVELAKLFRKDSLFTSNSMLKLIKDGARSFDYHIASNRESDLNRLELLGDLFLSPDSILFDIDRSDLVLNGDAWKVNSENSLAYAKNYLNIENLTIGNNKQLFKIETQKHGAETDLEIALKSINFNNVTDLLPVGSNEFYGIGNGSIRIADIFNDKAISGYIDLTDVVVNDDSLGNLTLNSRYEIDEDQLFVNGYLINSTNDVQFMGEYSLNKNQVGFMVDVEINNFYLPAANNFLQQYILNADGNINGRFKLEGDLKAPILTGELNLVDVEATIQYIHTHYWAYNQKVIFERNAVDLTGVVLTDQYGNTAKGNGKVYHTHFKQMLFDVEVESDRFHCLNTTIDLNPDYYGNVVADAYASFKGHPWDMHVYISGTTLDETYLAIPIDEQGDVSAYPFFEFVDKEKQIQREVTNVAKDVKGTSVILDINATPLATVALIFDLDAGDKVEATGSGNIKFQMDKYGEISMVGDYTIDEGDYLFTLQDIINKPFSIERGSFIRWLGDPYEAIISLDAVYGLRSSTYDLIQEYIAENAASDAITRAKKKVPVELHMHITENLLKPEISFDIELQNVDPIIRSDVENKLQLIRNNEAELNKQVFALLVLQRFVPSYSGGAASRVVNANFIGTGVANTVSEFVTTQISLYLTDWISTVVTDLDLDIKYNSYDELSIDGIDEALDRRRELQLLLTKRLFQDRISLAVGGNLDFGDNTNAQRGTNLTGDFEIEYLLTTDGRIRIKAFNRGEFDALDQSNRNVTGAGLAYREEYDNFKELINKIRFKKRKKQSPEADGK